jgi:hypothetical protein
MANNDRGMGSTEDNTQDTPSTRRRLEDEEETM